jgi:hypothetical protein
MNESDVIPFTRLWAMPNGETFSIPVIGDLVRRYLYKSRVSIDPFARNKKWATYTNDMNPATEAEYHMEARYFLKMLIERGIRADLLIFDPPYSPRQISECYSLAGKKASMVDTQNAKLVKECRDLMRLLVEPGAICLSFGWNSSGMGKGWQIEEIMLVAHGSCHNDTICLVERQVDRDRDQVEKKMEEAQKTLRRLQAIVAKEKAEKKLVEV